MPADLKPMIQRYLQKVASPYKPLSEMVGEGTTEGARNYPGGANSSLHLELPGLPKLSLSDESMKQMTNSKGVTYYDWIKGFGDEAKKEGMMIGDSWPENQLMNLFKAGWTPARGFEALAFEGQPKYSPEELDFIQKTFPQK